MSQAPTFADGHESQDRRAFGIWAAAAAVIASLLTATILSNSQPTTAVPDADVAPAVPVAAPTSPGTGVPEASSVFAGKDAPVEEPAPTF